VSSFYDRVLDSPVLEPYFRGIDMRRLIKITTLLRETLEDFDFDESDIGAVYGEVVSYRAFIVSRPAAAVGPADGA
jgi:hypothetical protein